MQTTVYEFVINKLKRSESSPFENELWFAEAGGDENNCHSTDDQPPQLDCLQLQLRVLLCRLCFGNPNARTKNDGVLRSALWTLKWHLDVSQFDSFSSRYSKALEVVKRLSEVGCRLDPSSKDEMQFLRACLIRLKTYDLIELIALLVQHNFAERKVFLNLMKNPAIRSKYDFHQPKLYRLFPELKPKKIG